MGMKVYGCLLILQLLILLVYGSVTTRGQGGKSVLCYFEGASAVRPQEEARFVPEDLDVTVCTHVVYNRALVSEESQIVPKDRAVDLEEEGGRGLYNRTLRLKENKPGLKIFIDVYDNTGVIKKHLDSGNRTALDGFAKNAADFVQSHGFDGMNIRSQQSQGFEEVLPKLHDEFVRRGLNLMTILMPSDFPIEFKIEMTESLSRNFDLIVVSSYWKLPGELTEIFSSLAGLETMVERHTALGVPAEKLVVAIPAFSVSVKVCDREESGVHSPICCAGDEGTYEPPEMILHSSELMRKMANTSEDWVVVRDPMAKVPYGHSKSRLWTSFEDPESVRAKANFILEKNLAGAAIMNVDMEDFKGSYTDGGEAFPLARAAFNALNG